MSDLRDRALKLYEAPFKLDHGYVWDAKGEMFADSVNGARIDPVVVAQVRGWGHIQKLEDPENLQDMVCELIVEALNDKWAGKIEQLEEEKKDLKQQQETASHNAKHYADMCVDLEEENKKLREVVESANWVVDTKGADISYLKSALIALDLKALGEK